MVKVGEKIPLTLQITDGNPNLEIVCRLFDPANLIWNTVELVHIKAGLYINLDLLMPPYPFIVAQYIIKNSEEYENVSEIFYADQLPEEKEMILTGQIVNMKLDEYLEGLINEAPNH